MYLLLILSNLLLCLLAPWAVVYAYRQGLRDGRAVRQDRPLGPLAEPRRGKEPPKTLEELNTEISLVNMLHYDGTADSQLPLKKEGQR